MEEISGDGLTELSGMSRGKCPAMDRGIFMGESSGNYPRDTVRDKCPGKCLGLFAGIFHGGICLGMGNARGLVDTQTNNFHRLYY